MASSIPAVRTFIADGLLALQATTLEGVDVVRTGKWDTSAEYERVQVLNAVDIDRQPRGFNRQDETYTVPIAIEATLDGDDLEAVENRLWDIVSAVETWLLANKQLGGAPVVNAYPNGFDDEQSGPGQSEDVVVAQTTFRLRVEAILSL